MKLLYLQLIEGVRTDVRLIFVEWYLKPGVDQLIASIPCQQSVYLATDTPPEYYQLDRLQQRYDVVPAGTVFRVVRDCTEVPVP